MTNNAFTVLQRKTLKVEKRIQVEPEHYAYLDNARRFGQSSFPKWLMFNVRRLAPEQVASPKFWLASRRLSLLPSNQSLVSAALDPKGR